jgi:hypothetical protein
MSLDYFTYTSMCIDCFIINSCSEFRQFLKRSLRSRRPSAAEIEKRVSREFVGWFEKRVSD